jgi:hypothetical protein
LLALAVGGIAGTASGVKCIRGVAVNEAAIHTLQAAAEEALSVVISCGPGGHQVMMDRMLDDTGRIGSSSSGSGKLLTVCGTQLDVVHHVHEAAIVMGPHPVMCPPLLCPYLDQVHAFRSDILVSGLRLLADEGAAQLSSGVHLTHMRGALPQHSECAALATFGPLTSGDVTVKLAHVLPAVEGTPPPSAYMYTMQYQSVYLGVIAEAAMSAMCMVTFAPQDEVSAYSVLRDGPERSSVRVALQQALAAVKTALGVRANGSLLSAVECANCMCVDWEAPESQLCTGCGCVTLCSDVCREAAASATHLHQACCGTNSSWPRIIVVPSSSSQLAVGRRSDCRPMLLMAASSVDDRQLTQPVAKESDRSLELLMRQTKPDAVSWGPDVSHQSC